MNIIIQRTEQIWSYRNGLLLFPSTFGIIYVVILIVFLTDDEEFSYIRGAHIDCAEEH